MNDLIAFATPMLVLAAIACGWMAHTVSPARGYGFLVDMALALAGSLLLASVLYGVSWPGRVGLVTTFLIGATGGALAIAAQRRFWQSPSLRT